MRRLHPHCSPTFQTCAGTCATLRTSGFPLCVLPEGCNHPRSIRPVRLRSALRGTGEDVISVLVVGPYFTPAGEHVSKPGIHRYRFPACLSFHLSDMLTHDSTAKADFPRREVHVSPLQPEKLRHAQPRSDCDIHRSSPRLRSSSSTLPISSAVSTSGIPHALPVRRITPSRPRILEPKSSKLLGSGTVLPITISPDRDTVCPWVKSSGATVSPVKQVPEKVESQ